jgi:hypothetical protein
MVEKKELEEGTKFDSDKLPYELLSPAALRGLVKVLKFGATKYFPRNWEKGIKFSRVYGAVLRHLTDEWWDRDDIDKETSLNHVFHALCDLMFLAHYISYPERYAEFDDRPPKITVPEEPCVPPAPTEHDIDDFRKMLERIKQEQYIKEF